MKGAKMMCTFLGHQLSVASPQPHLLLDPPGLRSILPGPQTHPTRLAPFQRASSYLKTLLRYLMSLFCGDTFQQGRTRNTTTRRRSKIRVLNFHFLRSSWSPANQSSPSGTKRTVCRGSTDAVWCHQKAKETRRMTCRR